MMMTLLPRKVTHLIFSFPKCILYDKFLIYGTITRKKILNNFVFLLVNEQFVNTHNFIEKGMSQS